MAMGLIIGVLHLYCPNSDHLDMLQRHIAENKKEFTEIYSASSAAKTETKAMSKTITDMYTHLDVINNRIALYKTELQSLAAEASTAKEKAEEMLVDWKTKTEIHAATHHESVEAWENEAMRLRNGVDGACARIERVFDEFGGLLGGEIYSGEIDKTCYLLALKRMAKLEA